MTDRGGTCVRRPVVLGPGEGRAYPMGGISAVFKADGAETGHGYSISQWWLDPHTKGPGAHSHPEDDVFYVLAGTMSVLVGASHSGSPSILQATRASEPWPNGAVAHISEGVNPR
jgi:mannose-6-phosphate isomerase-like protein (cupin superfamily)